MNIKSYNSLGNLAIAVVQGPKLYSEGKALLDSAISEYDQALFGVAANMIIGSTLPDEHADLI